MKDSGWSTYRRLLGYVWPYGLLFLVSVVGFLLGSGAEAYFLNLFGNLIDSWDEGLPDASFFIPVMMFSAVIVRGIGEVIGELLLSHISFSIVHNLRVQLFEQLLQMPGAFFDASSQGHLVSRITFNVAQLRDTGTDALKSIVQDGGKIIVYLAYMIYLNWMLTLIFIAAVPIVALVVVFAARRFRRIARRIQNSMGDVTHVTSETVSGYRVVRTFGGEAYERQRFLKASHTNRRQNLKMVVTKTASTHFVQILVVGAVSVLIALLARPELAAGLSTGDLVIFLALSGMLARPIRKLTDVNARLQRGLAAAQDIFGQLDQAIEPDTGTHRVERVQGRVEFRDVSFTYASGPSAVIRNVSFTIEPGQTVALVGKSGSGKSTLASLIPRFYDVESGEVLIDGVPVQDYEKYNLREQIALVTQQVTLFNDSLATNIAYGALQDAPPDAIADAVRRAHADGFIGQLPDGLDTVVGDDGVLLSGGQRQRVAIARALLKDAPILILDEATSALDTESERHIQAALEEVMRGRTTLVIAHRLSTVENADLILVVDAGSIVESGTHSSLMAQGKVYAALYDAQFEDGATAAAGTSEHGRVKPLAVDYIERTLSPLSSGWYQDAWWTRLLMPLSWLFGKLAARRRFQFATGKRTPWRADVPVVVVGNITVGGTGKTPFVIWLAGWLRARGFRPGIVSRGYGGRAGSSPLAVPVTNADPELYGDEAPILAKRSGCPVVVCANRVKAVKQLLSNGTVDIVVSDDGLQHYALARDVEIAVVDGHRGLGNGRLLPAGPLREPAERISEFDWVVSNGRASSLVEDEALMLVCPRAFIHLASGERLGVHEFAERYTDVHAVAGIGNPNRFAHTLRELGLRPLVHPLKDHHRYTGAEIEFADSWPIVCTEKDAVKLSQVDASLERCWYLEIDVSIDAKDEQRLTEILHAHAILK